MIWHRLIGHMVMPFKVIDAYKPWRCRHSRLAPPHRNQEGASLMIDVEMIDEERLTREEIADRLVNRENFRTAQIWGAKLSDGLYLTGSSALMNDDNEYRLSAVINWEGTILPASPLTNVQFYEELLAEG